jgi:hypothetical protein
MGGKPTTSIFEAALPARAPGPHEPIKKNALFWGAFSFILSWGFAYPKVSDLHCWKSASNGVLQTATGGDKRVIGGNGVRRTRILG